MPEDLTGKMPCRILNVNITTNDPLTASVLYSARSAKRLNAVLAMMLEAYLATPGGQVMAAQQLRIPVEELGSFLKPASAEMAAPVPAKAAAAVKGKEPARAAGAATINFDNLCS